MKKDIALPLFILPLLAAAFSGCSALESKAVGIGSQVNGIRIESAGGAQSGTVLPNLFFGSGQNSICTAPAMETGRTTQVAFAYTESSSLFGELFGLNIKSRTFSYIGLPGESAEQTRLRLEAAATLLKTDSELKNAQ